MSKSHNHEGNAGRPQFKNNEQVSLNTKKGHVQVLEIDDDIISVGGHVSMPIYER